MHIPDAVLDPKVAAATGVVAAAGLGVALRTIEKRMGDDGRVGLRASGTEPVIRVMVEGRNEETTRAAATELAEVVKAAAAA